MKIQINSVKEGLLKFMENENKDKEKNIIERLLRSIYEQGLDSIVLVGFVLLFSGSILVYLIEVFFGTPPAGGDLLTLLGVLLAILGLGGAGIYFWILRTVREEIKQDWEEQKSFSKAQGFALMSIVSMELYREVYKEHTQKEDDAGEPAKKRLEKAVLSGRKAIDCFKEIKGKQYLRESLLYRNNLAYYLARKWHYCREGRSDDVFREYLETKEMVKTYRAEKREANDCLNFVKNQKNFLNFLDIKRETIEDTMEWVEKVFSIDPPAN